MKESANIGYNFMLVDKNHLHAKSGTDAEETWDFFLELLNYARAGATLGGSGGGTVDVFPFRPEWTVQGNQLVAQLEVQSSNGYQLARSSTQVNISGYTAGAYDRLTITAPLEMLGQEVSLRFIANGGGNGVSLFWYEPVSAFSQAVAVARLGSGGGQGEELYVRITGGTTPVLRPPPHRRQRLRQRLPRKSPRSTSGSWTG